MQPLIGFIGPSYTLRSPNLDAQRCINLLPELNELGTGKNHEIAALIRTPGLKLVQAGANTTVEPSVSTYDVLPSGGNRGLYLSSSGRLFGVTGNIFWELLDIADTAGAQIPQKDMIVARGTIQTYTGPVSMTDNGNQLILVDGQTGYIYNLVAANVAPPPATGASLPPANPTVATDLLDGPNHWTNVNGALTPADSSFATVALPAIVGGASSTLKLSKYGIGNPSQPILGIQAVISLSAAGTTAFPVNVQLTKNGAATGSVKTITPSVGAGLQPFTLGGAGDLWGASLIGADLASDDFGIIIKVPANGHPGGLTGGQLTNNGRYTTPPTMVEIIGGGGTGATATIHTQFVPTIGWVVTGFTVTNLGHDYTSAPGVVFTDGDPIINATAVMFYTPPTSLAYTVSVDSGPLTVFVPNGVVVVDPNSVAGAFFEISDTDFPKAPSGRLDGGPVRVAFMDGYFIVPTASTRQFQISALYDGTDWDGLDIGLKEGAPDNLSTLIVANRQLWLLGEQTAEVWFNTGDPDFPFARIQGAFLEQGIAARETLQELDGGVYWVTKSRNGDAMVVQGLQLTSPRRISTYPLEEAIKSYGDISGATAYTYQEGGHSFYALNFPSADTTWHFDTSTSLWHERQSTTSVGYLSRHRAQTHAFYQGRHIVGDFESKNLYELSNSTYDDNGLPLPVIRSSPHVSSDGERIFFAAMQLDMETGKGLTSGQGSDPQVVLDMSDDGGHTWSREKITSAGKIGEYKRRVMWRRLGQSRDRVFRVKITDPIPVTLISALVEAQ